jgi:hypothetical protein
MPRHDMSVDRTCSLDGGPAIISTAALVSQRRG